MSSKLSMFVLLVQVASVCFLTGFICTLQVLDYPLIAHVGKESVPGYLSVHNRTFAYVLLPAFIPAIGSLLLLFAIRPTEVPVILVSAGLLCLLVIVISSGQLQTPDRMRLAAGWDAATLHHLVSTNWIRTGAYLIWAGLDLLMLWRVLSHRL